MGAALIKNPFPSIFCGFSKTDPQSNNDDQQQEKLELCWSYNEVEVKWGTDADCRVDELSVKWVYSWQNTAYSYCLLGEGGHEHNIYFHERREWGASVKRLALESKETECGVKQGHVMHPKWIREIDRWTEFTDNFAGLVYNTQKLRCFILKRIQKGKHHKVLTRYRLRAKQRHMRTSIQGRSYWF